MSAGSLSANFLRIKIIANTYLFVFSILTRSQRSISIASDRQNPVGTLSSASGKAFRSTFPLETKDFVYSHKKKAPYIPVNEPADVVVILPYSKIMNHYQATNRLFRQSSSQSALYLV
ncbi:hypothetical protein CS542_08105 [Pedobacter sp. IW39]|nr:hypothetical protein CS542_08105 [Pedobacter sp. IW39]